MDAIRASFVTTAMTLEGCPPFGRSEFAVVGRSNVGKSSLINTLAHQKGLARISKTPGRTQGINYFDFGAFLIADLPGYGYAKVSQAMQAKWRRELSRYLAGRETLQGVMHLMDARHPMQPNDMQMREFLLEHGIPLMVVLTKADELKQAEQTRVCRRVEEELGQEPVLFSSRTGRGRKELLRTLTHEAPERALASTAQDEPPAPAWDDEADALL
ncbi:MAG: ribosome biogenesis GTP-binding protein YihA/YsxC [Candidatus Sericytochromatia bacterium]|nr:ribosome biogenesis GTP-binding protein YihA/YsxC [Candidatus Sericytochromatia bacterium]